MERRVVIWWRLVFRVCFLRVSSGLVGMYSRRSVALYVYIRGSVSVVHGDVAEQVGHGLPVVDAADGLGQDHADVHGLDLGTLELLQLVGHGVGHHHLGATEDTGQALSGAFWFVDLS